MNKYTTILFLGFTCILSGTNHPKDHANLNTVPSEIIALIYKESAKETSPVLLMRTFKMLSKQFNNLFSKKEFQDILLLYKHQLVLSLHNHIRQGKSWLKIKKYINILRKKHKLYLEDIFFTPGKNGNTLMHVAQRYAPLDSIGLETIWRRYAYRTEYNYKKLHRAVLYREPEIVKILLTHMHPDVGHPWKYVFNNKGKRPCTITMSPGYYPSCLRIAVASGYPEIVTLLCAHGAHRNICYKSQYYLETPKTAWDYAVSTRNNEVLKSLLIYDMVPYSIKPNLKLHQLDSISFGTKKTSNSVDISDRTFKSLSRYIFSGGDVNKRVSLGPLLISYVIWSKTDGKLNQHVRLLLTHGAQVNLQDKHGNTALYYAVHQWNRPIAAMLLLKGASPTIKNKYGKSPLDIVVSEKIHQLLTKKLSREELLKECPLGFL